MLLLDHLLALLLVVVGPARSGAEGMRRLDRAEPESLPAIRRSIYRRGMAIQWGLAAVVLLLWVVARRTFDDIGLVPRLNGGLVGTAFGAALAGAVLVWQRRQALADPEALAQVRDRMRNVERVLPHTREDFAEFVRLSITAGVCEELLYRGYLIWYFSHVMPWWAAGVAAAVAFGLGHAYQGARGVAVTTVLGLFLAAVYFVSGSLVIPAAIHALMDLHSGHLAWKAYEREQAEAIERERAGAVGAEPEESADE